MKLIKKVTFEDPEINILHILNEYADQNPEFKSKFLDTCDEFFSKFDYLTMSQIDVLNEIYEKIKKW